MIKNLALMTLTMLMLTGCLGNLSKDGTFSTLTSTGAAVVTTVLAGPAAGAVAGVAAGVATDVAVSPEETTVDVLEVIPEEDRAAVLKNQKIWEAIEHLGVWILGLGAFVIFILPLIAGYLIPNGKQREQKKEMIKMKEALFDHPDIKMKDLK